MKASTPTITSPQSDGGCYFADSSSSSQTTLLQNGGMSTSAITDEIKCSCATKPDSLGLATDIFVAKADGTIQTYFTGSSVGTSTSSGFDTNKERCFRENTARFYSPVVRQCFSDLNSCKAANTAAAASSCTEADENKLFLIVPPATKTPIDSATEAAKKTSVLNCVKTGKTVTQCINTYFGAGPTSTALSNDNFARCTCLYDSNGILGTVCTLTGTACTKVCSLKKEGFANFQTSKAVTPSSPLAFIKVLSDFLFWLAVIIFVINFLRAGLSYAQSKGDETKLKEASAILTSTIGGIIFILLMGGLVRYILDTLGAAGLR